MSSPEARARSDPPPAPGPDAALVELARHSIRHGLEKGRPLTFVRAGAPAELCEPGACFVTLRRAGALRGCIGSLEPRRPLGEDAAQNAFAAAFRDPRFPPLTADELDGLELEIAVLGPRSPIETGSEQELLARLRPGVDGLVLRAGPRRATFLPAVWRSLPEPREFLAELKRKAGLPADAWSDDFRFERYTVREIH